jgi:hypothetical protein
MLKPRTIIAAALAVAGLAAPAVSAAQEIHETEYKAYLQVVAKWKYARDETIAPGERDEMTAEATLYATSRIDNILFRDGKLMTTERWSGPTDTLVEGSAWHRYQRPDPSKPGRVITEVHNCTPATGPAPLPSLLMDADSQPDHTGLSVRLLSGAPIGLDHCAPRIRGGVEFGNLAGFGAGTFDALIQLPHEVIGMGKVIELVTPLPVQVAPFYCPGKQPEVTTNCEFSWTGKLTLERTGGWLYDPAKEPPKPQFDPRADAVSKAVEQYGKPVPPPPPPVDPRADAISRAVEQYGKEPSIAPRGARQAGDKLTFTAGCPTGCTGTAVFTRGGGAKPRAAATLGRVTFKVPAGKPRKITIRLPRKARRAGRVAITLTPKSGAPVRATLTVKKR